MSTTWTRFCLLVAKEQPHHLTFPAVDIKTHVIEWYKAADQIIHGYEVEGLKETAAYFREKIRECKDLDVVWRQYLSDQVETDYLEAGIKIKRS